MDVVKIKASDALVQTYYVDGKIPTSGIAGVTGPYKGWFAADHQRPPVKAELKIFVGKVKIELEDWKGWNPKPK